jgi:thioredoxin 1
MSHDHRHHNSAGAIHRLLFCLLAWGSFALADDALADSTVAVRAALTSGQPALIEFGAETCSQCKRMKVVLDGISQRYKGRAHVVQVNVNKDQTVTRQFKIMVIPTLVFFDAKGKEVGRTFGFMDEVKVAMKLHDLGAR